MSFGPELARFIRATVGSLRWFAQHPGAVVSQAADGTVEVKPDSPGVGAQKGVPLRLGVPGIKVKVGPGTRVRMYFAGGEDGASEVALWEGDGLLELELDASVKVTLKAPAVHLGETDPAYSVALAEKVMDEVTSLRNTVNSLVTKFNGHGHAVSTTGTQSAQTGSTTSLTGGSASAPAVVQAMGSTTVKAKG